MSLSNPFVTPSERTSAAHPDGSRSSSSSSSQGQEQEQDKQAQGKQRRQGGGSIWNQWMTTTGWFAPLIPDDTPEVKEEKQRQLAEQRRLEKERSVHSWRPSEDPSSSASPSKGGPAGRVTRPGLMKRLSSAVELKWWASDAPVPEDGIQQDEEDLQQQRQQQQQQQQRGQDGNRQRAYSKSSLRSSHTPNLEPIGNDQDEEGSSGPTTARNSQEIPMR